MFESDKTIFQTSLEVYIVFVNGEFLKDLM